MASFDLSPPSGTRDFLPDEVKARERVIRTIKDVYERYGFGPLETPAFERLEILTGKYGTEGDKLIFKILKRGEQAATGEADFALRYDLTVPLARVVANNRQKLGPIWKRYHIAPVWRAERTQRGRYREFYQCDIDVVGAKGPVADAEILLAMSEALVACKLPTFTIKLNSRKVLRGLLEAYGIAEPTHQKAALIALDKLDKADPNEIQMELHSAGIDPRAVVKLRLDLDKEDRAGAVRERLSSVPIGAAGLAEVDTLRALVEPALAGGAIAFEPFLARGLDYYTGPIFEFGAPGLGSSIASGGRYDELVGMFSKEAVPACGGSLGLERIILLTQEQDKAPLGIPQVLVTVWNDESRADALALAREIRRGGASVETYPGDGAIGKQLKYASQKQVRFAVIVGDEERAGGLVAIKDLMSQSQRQVPRAQVAQEIAAALPRA